MKPIITIIGMIVVSLCSSISVSAYDFEVDGIYYSIISTGDLTCAVDGAKESDNLIIPNEVTFMGRGFKVTKINSIAGCENVKKVILPESVSKISGDVFSGCTYLASINIDNVTGLGSSAFKGCTYLASINIENVTYLGNSAFKGCTSLKSVKVPSKCLVNDEAFKDCTGLTDVEYLSPSIPESCFQDCSSLKTVVLNPNLTKIGIRAFSGCKSLQNISLPKSLESLGYLSFAYCESLESITIPYLVEIQNLKNPSSSGETVFLNCTGLKELIWEAKRIPLHFFQGCDNITSVIIGPEVEIIELSYFTTNYRQPEIFEVFGGSKITKLQFLAGKTLHFMMGKDHYWIQSPSSPSTVESYLPQNPSLFSSVENLYIDREIIGFYNYHTYSTIKHLIIGDNFKSTSAGADINWSNLESLKSEKIVPPYIPNDFTTEQYINMVVEVPLESLELYKNASVWRNFWNLTGYSGVPELNSVSENIIIGRFDISGVPVDENYKGLVIVHFSNGKSKKILQK